MLKALVTAGAYTSGNVPFTIQQNTNTKYALDLTDNSFDIKVAGLSEIKANVVVTATASGVLALTAYANGVPIAGAVDQQTVASGSTYTFHINDIVKTINIANAGYANISLQFDGATTLVNGDLILLYQR